MRFLVIGLLLFAAHLSLTGIAPAAAGKAWILWPLAADSRPLISTMGGVSADLSRLLSVIAGACFLGGALALLGWLVPPSWWMPLGVVGAGASILLYVQFIGPWAVLPILLDVLLLWGILVQHWTVAGLRGLG